MCEFDGELRDVGPVPEDLLGPLDRKIAEDPGLWVRGDLAKPNRFGVFQGTTMHIVFQYPVTRASHEVSAYHDLWPEWKGVLQPVIDRAVESYGYPNGRTTRIMLARLLAGKEIGFHVDGSPSAEVPHKVHVPLTTNQGVRFSIGEGTYHLERGRAYEVNNRRRHAVANLGADDRVHLIFDYYDAG